MRREPSRTETPGDRSVSLSDAAAAAVSSVRRSRRGRRCVSDSRPGRGRDTASRRPVSGSPGAAVQSAAVAADDDDDRGEPGRRRRRRWTAFGRLADVTVFRRLLCLYSTYRRTNRQHCCRRVSWIAVEVSYIQLRPRLHVYTTLCMMFIEEQKLAKLSLLLLIIIKLYLLSKRHVHQPQP